jgi:Tfp pilus assembly protein PilF
MQLGSRHSRYWLAALAPVILMDKVQMKKGSPDLAAGFLDRALKMDPNNYLAHYQLGRAEDAKREFEATRLLREVKEP